MGLGLMELCALYFSRTLLTTLGGTPFVDETERAFAKIERALPPGCRKFLDELPRMLKAKPRGRKIADDDRRLREVLGRALDATLLHRRAAMRYASASSQQTKEYLVDPQRIVYADGGIYLVAWVPAYAGMRTFAAERIETFGLTDEKFAPRALPLEPFGDSLGVNTGAPETIVLEFDAAAAPFVREREWHTLAGDGGPRRRRCRPDAHSLQRLRAARLDPRLRSRRPRRLTHRPRGGDL